jgi:hypothetical protein
LSEFLTSDEIDFTQVSANIPYVLQTLYIEKVLNSINLAEFRDCFRVNQMQGKAWLLDQLKDVDRKVPILVIGSWMGFTSYCLYKQGFDNITETDPDSRLELMANTLNQQNSNFKHLNKDVNDIDVSQYGLIINTSCEHIGNNVWFDRISSGCLVALQSTNLKWHDHVNTVENVEEMKLKYNLNLQYSGQLKFNDVYSRFMLVGTKP